MRSDSSVGWYVLNNIKLCSYQHSLMVVLHCQMCCHLLLSRTELGAEAGVNQVTNLSLVDDSEAVEALAQEILGNRV